MHSVAKSAGEYAYVNGIRLYYEIHGSLPSISRVTAAPPTSIDRSP